MPRVKELYAKKLSAAMVFAIAMAVVFAVTGCSGQTITLIDRLENHPNQTGANGKARVKGISIKQSQAGWSFDRTINNPLQATVENDRVQIGDLNQDYVNVKIPEKTLDTGTTVTLSTANGARPAIEGDFRPLGTPYKIEAVNKDGVKVLRTKEPVLVEMRIDKDKLERNFDRGSLQIAYFNGNRWDYIKPSKLDLDNEVLSFRVFHLGVFGYGLVSQDEVIRQYVHRKILTGFVHTISSFKEANIWKFAEIEAAYAAYKDGSKGELWGFDNDARDFDRVWDQARGIFYLLENDIIDARSEKSKNVENVKLDERLNDGAGEQETNTIRDNFKKSVKEQFDYRLKNQDELGEKEVELSSIIYAYKLARLIEPGTFGFDVTTTTVESRIDDLLNLKDKIMRDTRRLKIADSSMSGEDTLSIGDLVVLSQLWLSDNGESKYARYLKDELKIDITQKK
jgi:hypothetical protein